MSNAFMKFHDFAVASGLLDSSSELGRQLLATKERFITISQAGGDDSDANDDREGRRRGSTSTTDSLGSDRRRKGTIQPDSQGNSPECTIEPSTTESTRQLFPGLTVTHEPISQSYLTTAPHADLSLSIPTTSQTTEFHPTTTASSFPKTFDLPTVDFDFDFLSPPQPQPQPQISSPYSIIPVPSSYASHEITFGRRYQRFAIERAHMLVTMPDPPLDKLSKAFGFCLLFESPDMIFQRTLKAIARSTNESLYNWQYPFYHLGGAGTHASPGGPLNSTLTLEAGMRMHLNFSRQVVGNQGTIDVLKPHAELTAGFGMGPFPPAVNNARDNWLDRDMKMCLPGFQGEYYDCDEVEFYFHQRGVVIPPGADEYTVEIYPAQFGVGSVAGVAGGSGSLEELDLACLDSVVSQNFAAPGGAAGSPPSSMDYSSNSIVSDDIPLHQQQPPTGNKPLTPSGSMSSSLSPPSTVCEDWASRFLGVPQQPQPNDNFDFPDPAPENNNNMYMSPKSSPSSRSTTTGTGSTAATTSFDQHQPTPRQQQPQQMWNQRMLVTIDVNQLVIELTDRAICLGRTPGIRVDDINAAFWKSLSMSVSL